MRERPILFSAPMVRAILDHRKTQTRRPIKRENAPSPGLEWAECLCREIDPADAPCVVCDARFGACPYGEPGDRLWVRETWAVGHEVDDLPPNAVRAHAPGLWLRADHPERPYRPGRGRWRSSIHMPRWASRLTLEVTSIHVERLHDISEEDARAEGAVPFECIADDQRIAGDAAGRTQGTHPYTIAFASLWDEVYGPGAWAANPWLWVVGFRRVEDGNHG